MIILKVWLQISSLVYTAVLSKLRKKNDTDRDIILLLIPVKNKEMQIWI